MSRLTVQARVEGGKLVAPPLPLEDMDVTIIIVPQADLSKMSFAEGRKLSQDLKGNLSDDVVLERRGS